MNRAILVGSVIVGIAVMLSMSMIPANAETPQNVCIRDHRGGGVDCRILPTDNQHVVLILAPQDKSGGCHYKISDMVSFWKFNYEHGPEHCPSTFMEIKEFVSVRGS